LNAHTHHLLRAWTYGTAAEVTEAVAALRLVMLRQTPLVQRMLVRDHKHQFEERRFDARQ